MSKNRDAQLDAVKGLLIYMVVLGHMIEPFRGHGWVMHVYKFIYLFHMPAFIFISGLLTNKNFDAAYARSLITRILIPLAIFECLYVGLHYILHDALPGNVKNLAPYWVLWFLLSLFFWRLMAPVFLQLHYPLTISIIIALIGLSSRHSGGYLSLARTFSFLPFYVAGLVYGEKILAGIRARGNWLWLGVSFVILILLFWISNEFQRPILFGSVSFLRMKLGFADGSQLRLLAWLLSFAAMAALIRVTPVWSWLARWGRQSLDIYIWHGLLLMLLREMVNWQSMNNHRLFAFCVSMLLAGLLCMLLASALVHHITEIIMRYPRRSLGKPITRRN